MPNPINELVVNRERLSLPENERKLRQRLRQFDRKLQQEILDDFSIRLLRRYEGGLTQAQKFAVIRDFKRTRVKRRLREAFFDHYVERNGERVLRYGLQGDLLELFRNTAYDAFDREQQAIAKAFSKGSSMQVLARLTGADRKRLKKIVIGGITLADYVKVVLQESYERLLSRISQAVMIELTLNAMITRMRREADLMMDKLTKRLEAYRFEVESMAANMAQHDFITALRDA